MLILKAMLLIDIFIHTLAYGHDRKNRIVNISDRNAFFFSADEFNLNSSVL